MVTKQEIEEERQNRIADCEIQSFYSAVVPYGSIDVRAAIDFCLKVDLDGNDLADLVTEFCDDTGSKITDVDICYIAYDHVLQRARNKISEVLDYDFMNDGPGHIDVYGNYMCTSYDYTEDAVEELREKIKAATEDQKEELRENKFVVCFLQEIDIAVLE